jgi:uncharacterized damage-inducible protein DinB
MPETSQQYIDRMLNYVQGQDAIKVQRATPGKLKRAINGLSPKQLHWKPEPRRWSIAEILAHLSDAEIVCSWRMRAAVGSNGIPIQPFDQDVWASAFEYNRREAERSLELFSVLRDHNLAMLATLPAQSWDNYGMHAERGKETIVHIVRMFAGHDTNHILQVERLAIELRKQAKSSVAKKSSKAKTRSKKARPAKRKRRK